MILKIEKSFYKSLDKIDYSKIADKIEAILRNRKCKKYTPDKEHQKDDRL